MDANRKRTLILSAVVAVIVLGYFGVTQLYAPDEQPEQARPRQPSAQQSQARASLEERLEQRETATIRTDRFVATIDNIGGGVSELRLIGDDRFEDEDGDPTDIITTNASRYPEYEALAIELRRLGLPGEGDLVWDIEQVSEREVRLSWEGEGLRVQRTLKAGDGPYQIWQTVRVTNTRRRPVTTRLEVGVTRNVTREQEGGGGFSFIGSRSPEITHGTCVYDDEIERVDRDSLAPEGEPKVPHGYGARNVHVAAVESTYFVLAAASHGEPAQRCSLYASNRGTREAINETLFESRLVYRWDTIAPGETRTWRTLGYLGPKDPDALAAAGHRLSEVLDLGFFALIASQLARLLAFIHGVLPEGPLQNWGLAIILLTLLVRLALFPLTNLSFSSMSRMRQLKPEIDRINELYKDDQEKKGAAVMELYRKHKINPLSGCLPMLLQLPIWWALYTSLSTNIELYHMPFTLWWTDLSGPDPYFVLPVALGVLMHVQQRLTPTTMDPMQAKMMMWFMPVMITVFMLFLPAGLCLYMLTNSVLGIGQQKLNEHRLNRAAAATQAAPPHAPDATGEGADDEGDDGPDTDGEGEDDTSSSQGPTKRRPRRKRLKRTRRGRA